MTPAEFADWATVVVFAFCALGISYNIFWKDG